MYLHSNSNQILLHCMGNIHNNRIDKYKSPFVWRPGFVWERLWKTRPTLPLHHYNQAYYLPPLLRWGGAADFSWDAAAAAAVPWWQIRSPAPLVRYIFLWTKWRDWANQGWMKLVRRWRRRLCFSQFRAVDLVEEPPRLCRRTPPSSKQPKATLATIMVCIKSIYHSLEIFHNWKDSNNGIPPPFGARRDDFSVTFVKNKIAKKTQCSKFFLANFSLICGLFWRGGILLSIISILILVVYNVK